jgi:cobalt/nickel transport protein
VFCLVPEPIGEENEKFFIQQSTKVFIQRGRGAGGWKDPAGLPVEIVPLAKPYDRWTGTCSRDRSSSTASRWPGARSRSST